MSKARTIRFTDQLDSMVDEYTDKNGLKVNQLVNIAVKKFISERNTIKLEPIEASDSAWEKGIKKSFKKHRKAMDELA